VGADVDAEHAAVPDDELADLDAAVPDDELAELEAAVPDDDGPADRPADLLPRDDAAGLVEPCSVRSHC
jgi:hypothetical protein